MEAIKAEVRELVDNFTPSFQIPEGEPLHVEVQGRPVSASEEQIAAARSFGERLAFMAALSKKMRDLEKRLGNCPGHVFGQDSVGEAYFLRKCVFCGNVDVI